MKGVKEVPFDQTARSPIQNVSDERMSNMGHVNSDLVRPASLQVKFDMAVSG